MPKSRRLFFFLVVVLLIPIISLNVSAAWQSCSEESSGVWAKWSGKWYWYGNYCYSSSYKKEYYCEGNAPYYRYPYCQYGCSNNACNPPPCTPSCSGDRCGQSDGCGGTCSGDEDACGKCGNAACCTDDCSSGQTNCLFGQFRQECERGNDGCYHWVNREACTHGCSNGACNPPPCTPATCVSLGKSCDSWDDGCGGSVSCGNCPSGQLCQDGKCVSSCDCSGTGCRPSVSSQKCDGCNWVTSNCGECGRCCPSAETCDGKDNDCDGSIDEGAVCGYNLDGSADGCINDADYNIFTSHYQQSASGANGKYDFNGDGTINYGDYVLLKQNYNEKTYYRDADGDGYGSASSTVNSCKGAPSGYVSSSNDCDDTNNKVYPGNSNEFCDCNAGTGGGSTKGVAEICDNKDNNCDGTVDQMACNDGNSCTRNDYCTAGKCSGTGNSGDISFNGVVDYMDFLVFTKCYQGNCNSPPSGCTVQQCQSADFDGNNIVQFTDFVCFLPKYGKPVPCTSRKAGCGDSNGDGVVDFTDLIQFGQCFGTMSSGCFRFDYNLDGDIDQEDFYCFYEDYGASKQVDCSCIKDVGCSDSDKDGTVNFADLVKFGQCFGKKVGDDPGCFIFDYNLDNTISNSDYYCFADDYMKAVDCSCGVTTNCRSDADGSGKVDFQDFMKFSNCFGMTSSYCKQHFDYNANNIINYRDFYCFIDDWGRDCCKPSEAGLCSDGIDNDCDGTIDAADSDCCLPAGSSATCTTDSRCCGGAYCSKKDPDGTERPSSQWHCCRKGDQYWDPYEGPQGGCVESGGGCGPVCSYDTSNPQSYFNPANNCITPSSQPYRQSCCSVDIYGQTDKRYMDVNVY